MQNKQLLYDIFQAYYDARKNKRNTINQLDFEFNLEENIINLYEELSSWNYEVWKSIYFIQKYPVKREIFAWNFRDRIVHHLIYNYISPIFEKDFIYDSYSCRTWKWTSFWIKRLNKFIRSCSENYTNDCYILKLDISGYFMSIDKQILFEKIKEVLFCRECGSAFPTIEFLLNLIEKIIFNDCTKNSVFKWKRQDYVWLPKNKSLFFANTLCWLPIWNLTSQLFSNIYLSDFDKIIKNEWNCKYYGRYVDDFFIVHKDKDYLKSLIPKINDYLSENLKLTLHPKKIYLQHYSKWVLFLWSFIKPYRNYVRKRTLWNFYNTVIKVNKTFKNNEIITKQDFQNKIISPINSYLWFIKNTKSFKVKSKILKKLDKELLNFLNIEPDFSKITIKPLLTTKSF